MEKKRNINLDLLRVFCMIAVISLHTYPRPLESHKLIYTAYSIFLISCDCLFYMLSGYFNLSKTFDSKEDYWNYYAKKIIMLVIPYFLVTVVYAFYWYGFREPSFSIKFVFSQIYKLFWSENLYSHLWFLFPLFGMLLSAPFFSRMLQNMKDWEVNLVFFIALGWHFVSVQLVKNMGISFEYTGWFLEGWVIAFFAGYYCYRMIKEQNKKNGIYSEFWDILST